MEEGTIQSDARAWSLLADSWLNARDRRRALPPLKRAAELSENGDSYVRLGQLQLEREEWAAASASFAAALRKGGVRSEGHVYVLLGITNVNQARWDEAKDAFSQAGQCEQSETMARHWLQHLATAQTTTAETAGVQSIRKDDEPQKAGSLANPRLAALQP